MKRKRGRKRTTKREFELTNRGGVVWRRKEEGHDEKQEGQARRKRKGKTSRKKCRNKRTGRRVGEDNNEQ